MTRNMDLVREILRHLAAQPAGTIVQEIVLPGFDQAVIAEHLRIMHEANLVDAHFAMGSRGSPSSYAVTHITWDGHEFLDLANNDTLWNRIRDRAKQESITLGFDLLKTGLQLGAAAWMRTIFPGS